MSDFIDDDSQSENVVSCSLISLWNLRSISSHFRSAVVLSPSQQTMVWGGTHTKQMQIKPAALCAKQILTTNIATQLHDLFVIMIVTLQD